MLITGGKDSIYPSLLYTPGEGWTQLPALPVETFFHCQVTQEDTTFIIGGYQAGKPLGGTYRSTNGGQWEEVAPMLTRRQQHACVEWDKKIVAIGGFDNDHARLSSVESYDTAANKWSSLPPLPIPLDGMQAVVYKDSLYVVGGRSQGFLRYKPVYELKPGSEKWVVVPGVTVDHALHRYAVNPPPIFNNLHCKE